jgi:DNA mismatch repair protein MutS
LRDGGVIAPGYDAQDLDELRDIQDNCGAFLLALETRERERTGIATLKVEFNKVHGFYIEVTHASANSGQDPRRLPPPPDTEKCRAIHHARTQGLRGQGALGQ